MLLVVTSSTWVVLSGFRSSYHLIMPWWAMRPPPHRRIWFCTPPPTTQILWNFIGSNFHMIVFWSGFRSSIIWSSMPRCAWRPQHLHHPPPPPHQYPSPLWKRKLIREKKIEFDSFCSSGNDNHSNLITSMHGCIIIPHTKAAVVQIVPKKNYNRNLGIDCERTLSGIWKIKPDYETMTIFLQFSEDTIWFG